MMAWKKILRGLPLLWLGASTLAPQAMGACTLGTGVCCQAAGGPSDNPATKIIWTPDAGTTVWTNTNNWQPRNVPNAANEFAYIQSDWQVPAWPAASYSLACLEIGSGSMTATPAGSTVTISIPSSTVTASIRSSTATISIPSSTVTASIRSSTATISIPSSTATITIPASASVTATNGSDRINWTAHGKSVGDPIILTGTMPNTSPAGQLVSGVVYFVYSVLNANRITLTATPGGSLINMTSNGSGLTATSPSVITWNGHGLSAGDPVSFTTTGTLPTGITAGTTYYVAASPAPTANTFSISATPGGNAFRASGTQSGTHTARARGLVTWNSHGLSADTPVVLSTTGSLPTGLTAGTTYYVANTPAPTANTFALATTVGGTAIITSGSQSGTHTASSAGLINWTGHGLVADTPVSFTTTGSLPTGITAGTTYYVASAPPPTANAFAVSATPGGTAILFSGSQSGVHTGGSVGVVTWNSHGLSANTPVRFTTTGSLPTGITAGTTYYVASTPAPTTNTFTISTTAGGAALQTSGSQSGTHTATTAGLINWTGHSMVAGYAVSFNTTGSLPTGITAGTQYFIAADPAPTTNSFAITSTYGGTAIYFTGSQSGTHTGRSPGIVTLNAHGLSDGTPVSFTTTGSLPTGLTAGTTYYVATVPAPAANTFAVSTTPGGPAVITSGTQSGTHTLGARILSVVGENFTNLTPGSLTTNANFVVRMAGTNPQTLANVDPLHKVVIDNATSVSIPKLFTVTTSFALASGTGTVQLGEGLTLSYSDAPLYIPSSATLEVLGGGVLTAPGGITVDGILKVNAGARVLLGNGSTLVVNAGGLLQLQGTSGNAASIDAAEGGSTYNLNVAGSLNANYFTINRTTSNGLNITTAGSDSIQTLSNGDFHYIASGGHAITLNTAKNLPSPDPSGLGFFDDFSYGNVKNINATNYTGTSVTINNWSGLGGAANETDPGGKIAWGGQAALALQISNQTASGNPPSTIAKGSADTLFTTFGFSLNSAGTSSDITQVKFTLAGSNIASDVKYAKIYGDANANCVYNAGVDSQIGSDLTFVGSPPTATITIPAATVTVSDTTPKCIHVVLATNPNAQTGDTLRVSVVGTADVTNSEAYSFSENSGPPVSGGTATITGSAVKRWGGGNGPNGGAQNWNANAGDWTPSGAPATTDDCQIGPAYSYPQMNASYTCTNMSLPSSGRMGWNNTTNSLNILGALTVGSSYTFTAAANGNVTLNSSAASQSLSGSTALAGNLVINNTYGGDGLVSVDSDFTVTGNLTLTRGVLTVTSGTTLTILGNASVNGGSLVVEPGGTFNLGDGRTLTVGASGTLRLVGNSSQTANFTCNGTTTGCAITVDGTIQAQYYSLNRLAVAGLTINSGATIDGTYFLQNGTFTYPIGSSPILLRLNRQVPGNALDYMTFDTAGSPATSPQSILTNAAAGTLTVSNYSGDLTNCCTTAPTYLVAWNSPTTTLKLTLEGSAPASVDQGDTGVVLGSYGLQQTQAGPYDDTDVTSMKFTLKGSQNASDVTALRLYYDSGCSGSGVQIGSSQTFSGSPPTATFSGLTGATVEGDVSSPPKRCFYVEADIAAGATIANTVGVSVESNADVVNTEGYAFNGSFSPPVASGTSLINGNTITWTGTSSSDWGTAANWNLNRLPTASDNCVINSAANNPIISAAGAVCKALTIGNGTLTVNTGQTISLYGSLTNTGTLTLTGTGSVTVRDDGVTNTNQTLQSSSTLSNVVFNKTAGGFVYIGNQNLTIGNFSIPASQNFTFNIRNNDVLTLPNGGTLNSALFLLDGGGQVRVGDGTTFTVQGGTLQIQGINDANPQNLNTKGKFTVDGAGSWSFIATSGTLNFSGFIFDALDANGVRVNGTTTLSNLNGGQFTSLNSDFANLKALQINTSGSVPTTATNVGWNFAPGTVAPDFSQFYLVGYSSGCAGQTITFEEWFGDWFTDPFDTPEDKVDTTSCSLILGASASAVTLANLSATGYDGAVSVDWETTTEINHQGFHVLRSTNPLIGYVRVNSEIIRNDVSSTTGKGKYRYLDETVENGKVYYYLVQDVDINGTTQLHGPVSALTGYELGDPPGAAPDVNEEEAQDGEPEPGDEPDVANGGVKDLGYGVKIIAQTSATFRLEIVPPEHQLTVSGWNALYEQVRIPGYASTLAPGKPELPERTILIEVDGTYGTASASTLVLDEAAPSAHRIQPAPTWTANGMGVLEPTYQPDGAAYADDTTLPSTYYSVAPDLVTVAGKSYLALTVNPLRYQALSQTLHRSDRIVLEVYLGGSPWQVDPPDSAYQVSPSAVEGALRIRFASSGLYEVTFEDLEAAGVEGPFQGKDTATFRLFSKGVEIPLEVIGPANFGAGSVLRFAGVYERQLEDDFSEVVLTGFSLGSLDPPLRMDTLDGDPTGLPVSPMSYTVAEAKAEQDLTYIFDVPFASLADRFYWKRIYAQGGSSGLPTALFNIPVSLPNLIADGNLSVHVDIYLRGRKVSSMDPTHHVGLRVNAIPGLVGDTLFTESGPALVSYDLPSTYFAPGNNTLTLEAISDLVVHPDYQIIDLDRVRVEYPSDLKAHQGVARLRDPYVGGTLTLTGFTAGADIALYDISQPTRTTRILNAINESIDGNVTFQTTFGLRRGLAPDLGDEIVAIEDGKFLKPAQVALVGDFGDSLRAAARGADLIIVGSDVMLDEAANLVQHRQSQGLRVARVTPSQIYAEFSHGSVSSQAIRDFIRYAVANWVAPAPKYLLFLGDASPDPRDRMEYGNLGVMPMPVLKGTYEDFTTDHWFVADDQDVALLAVGRIPTRDPNVLKGFISKLIAYENGSRAPAGDAGRKVYYIADRDSVNEEFEKKAALLGDSFANEFPDYTAMYLNRNSAASDAAFKSSIQGAFTSSPLLITYVGHGAENLWAALGVFGTNEASSLSHTRLPLVMALNCLNAHSSDMDPEIVSLGEALVLNPNGGTPAFLGFTTMTIPNAQVGLQTALQNEFATEIVKNTGELRLGDLMLRAKSALGATPHATDAVKSFSLVGDPSMAVPRALLVPASTPPAAPPDEPAVEAPPESRAAPAAEGGGGGGGGCLRARNRDSGAPSTGAYLVLFLLLTLTGAARRWALSYPNAKGGCEADASERSLTVDGASTDTERP